MQISRQFSESSPDLVLAFTYRQRLDDEHYFTADENLYYTRRGNVLWIRDRRPAKPVGPAVYRRPEKPHLQ